MKKIIGVFLIGIPLAVIIGGVISVFGLLNASVTIGVALVLAAMIIAGVNFISG